jgi:putative membrane protein
MRLIVWLFRAFIFFTLFAFALNNQQAATVQLVLRRAVARPHGHRGAGGLRGGCAVGVLAMVPSWWRHRRHGASACARAARVPGRCPPLPSEFGPEHPPRVGPLSHGSPAWTLTCSGC